ncbi:unnamed protein product [Rodentolepis nana]|uniref:Cyclin N-terminal domain-containing protein n=1 Tax=Rodentolepis nana TaxID=102285 RepID=A0A0R3T447_RODNA|nr:unnamed protein product [Rodentolepis nana]
MLDIQRIPFYSGQDMTSKLNFCGLLSLDKLADYRVNYKATIEFLEERYCLEDSHMGRKLITTELLVMDCLKCSAGVDPAVHVNGVADLVLIGS